MLNLLRRVDRGSAEFESWLVALLLGVSVLLNFALVVSRYVFSHSVNQLEELSVYLAIWLVFVGAVACDRRRQHIALDIVYHLLPPARQEVLRRVADFLQGCLCLYLAWLTLKTVLFTYQLGEVSLSSLRAPVWLLMAVMPPAFALIGLRSLLRGVVAGYADLPAEAESLS
ncbi:MAG: TRAP transporter small permease [Burkholderiales bacterium]|nr:TRAP transporter small permease [Burkholderiales bacterium]